MSKCQNCENELIYCDRKGDEGWAHIINADGSLPDEPLCKNPVPTPDNCKEWFG